MDDLLYDMESKGLASRGSSDWIERAVYQHNPNLTLLLCSSVMVRPLGRLDLILHTRKTDGGWSPTISTIEGKN